jgi:hypothetical protein
LSKRTWSRDTSGLAAHAKQRSVEKRKRVDEAIDRLLREQQTINFNSVAMSAGVSKAYLYGQPELRERIEALRHQQLEHGVRERMVRPVGKTDVSKDLVMLAKERRIKDLEAENRQLKKQLQVALGKAYDRL